MGWTGRVSADEYQALRGDGYLADDIIGKQGVEATFESELRGQYGVQQVQRDAAGSRRERAQDAPGPRGGRLARS